MTLYQKPCSWRSPWLLRWYLARSAFRQSIYSEKSHSLEELICLGESSYQGFDKLKVAFCDEQSAIAYFFSLFDEFVASKHNELEELQPDLLAVLATSTESKPVRHNTQPHSSNSL